MAAYRPERGHRHDDSPLPGNRSRKAAYKHSSSGPRVRTVNTSESHSGSQRRQLAARVRRTSRAQEDRFVEQDTHEELIHLGRFPFVCAYRRYLRGVRARLSELTIAERERKLHHMARLVQRLHGVGKIGSTNPAKFEEDDIIEIFLALKARGIACETLRKYISMLKSVTRECRNTVVDEMLAKGKLVVGSDRREPTSLDKEELEALLDASKQVSGWKRVVCRFSIAMMAFMMLRPGELQKASIGDLNTAKWTFLVANPKGKERYGEVKQLPIPDVLKPYVLEYLGERDRMLRSRGIENATPLVPSIVCNKAGFYTQQGFGRLKKAIVEKSGIHFKWKTMRPTGGQLALDAGVPIDMISRMMRHTSVLTTERYYCRARADLAYARVNEAYNSLFGHEPAIAEKSV